MSEPYLRRVFAAVARPAVLAVSLGLLAAVLALSGLLVTVTTDGGGPGGLAGVWRLLMEFGAAGALAAAAWAVHARRWAPRSATTPEEAVDTPERVRQMLKQQEAYWRQQMDSRDLAHRKAAQRLNQWHELLDAFPGWVVTIRPDGSIGHANAAVAAFYGLQGFQLAGRPAEEVLGSSVAAAIRRRNLRISAEGKAIRFDMVLKAPDGSATELMATQFIVGLVAGSASMTCLIAIDRRGQRGIAERDAQTLEVAVRAARLSSERLAALAHALEAPAQALLNLDRGDVDGDAESAPAPIWQPIGEQVARLARQAAELVRLETEPADVDIEPVDLVEASRAALMVVEGLAGSRDVQLRSASAMHGQLWVEAESHRLHAALRAVFETAVLHSQASDVIDVRWSVDGEDATVTCTVQGTVFAPEAEPRPMTLMLAQGWLDGLRGRLQWQATDAGGSECRVWLKASPVPDGTDEFEADPLADAQDAGSASDVPKREILVLTQQPDQLRALRRALQDRPLVRVRTAETVEDALDLCARVAPDCVVWDAGDAQIDGPRFVSRIRTLAYTRPIRLVALVPAPTEGGASSDARTGALAGSDLDGTWSWPLQTERVLSELDALLAAAPIDETVFDAAELESADHMPA